MGFSQRDLGRAGVGHRGPTPGHHPFLMGWLTAATMAIAIVAAVGKWVIRWLDATGWLPVIALFWAITIIGLFVFTRAAGRQARDTQLRGGGKM